MLSKFAVGSSLVPPRWWRRWSTHASLMRAVDRLGEHMLAHGDLVAGSVYRERATLAQAVDALIDEYKRLGGVL